MMTHNSNNNNNNSNLLFETMVHVDKKIYIYIIKFRLNMEINKKKTVINIKLHDEYIHAFILHYCNSYIQY